jgi:hypothetical protein
VDECKPLVGGGSGGGPAVNAAGAVALDGVLRGSRDQQQRAAESTVVGRCRWTPSRPVLKAPMVSVLETTMC